MRFLNWLIEHKILLTLVFLGAVLRLYKLDFQSPWIDEIFSLLHTKPGVTFDQIYSFLKTSDPHPPLYYWSLKIFCAIVGHSIYTARLFSAFIGISGLLMVYKLAKEIFNKRVALFSLALLSVNFFHIYYSQEIRMYSMMFLTTTASFYFLVRYIKGSSHKNMLLYAFFSAVMIYVQFFSLFTLFSQYLILLYFVVFPYKTTSLKFLKQSIISGLITLVLYIPAIPIFLQTFKMTSIWIPIPESDFMSKMFKDFFGQSEFAIWIIVLGIILFIVKLFSKSDEVKIVTPENKNVFSFFIFLLWIFITITIPLLSSYINLPMIVNRYFINILPPIIIMSASGLDYIKNNVIKNTIVAFFIIFSTIQLVYLNDYYNKITKTQFRELTDKVKEEIKGEPTNVAFYWSWLLPYFFENENYKIKSYDLDSFVRALKENRLTSESFWYIDGHEREFTISPENAIFLNENYIKQREYKYFDCWANYYVPKNYVKSKNEGLSIRSFKSITFDGENNLAFFQNGELKANLDLTPGSYVMVVKAKSTPEKPIENKNAHLQIFLNSNNIGNEYISENPYYTEYNFPFKIEGPSDNKIKLVFDNDYSKNNLDRNLIINSIQIKKSE